MKLPDIDGTWERCDTQLISDGNHHEITHVTYKRLPAPKKQSLYEEWWDSASPESSMKFFCDRIEQLDDCLVAYIRGQENLRATVVSLEQKNAKIEAALKIAAWERIEALESKLDAIKRACEKDIKYGSYASSFAKDILQELEKV